MATLSPPPLLLHAHSSASALYRLSPSPSLRRPRPPGAGVRVPPPGFDYMEAMAEDSRRRASGDCPDLMDLVEEGSLVAVEKARFGPVPSWRSEFVEPEVIWVLGTSHVSERSARDVARVVAAVRPDNVVVELCRSRAGIMYYSSDDQMQPLLRSNMFSLSGSKFWDAIGRSINLGGQSALALRLLLAAFSSKISSSTQRPFGDEFRAARKAAEEVGAQIVLGDRPIEITLERAWRSLNGPEKLRFLSSLLRGVFSESLDIHKNSLQGGDLGHSFQLYEQLGISYPSLLQPLVHERDVYLAWSLKRSKAVNEGKRIVGIIGKGHLNGVIHALISDQANIRFRDLVGKNPSDGGSNSWTMSLLKGLVRDTIIGIVVWAVFELSKSKVP